MNMLARLLAPLNHSGMEKRKENLSVHEANERQTEQVLRDEREAQSLIVISATDPEVREIAQREIERINCLLRKS